MRCTAGWRPPGARSTIAAGLEIDEIQQQAKLVLMLQIVLRCIGGLTLCCAAMRLLRNRISRRCRSQWQFEDERVRVQEQVAGQFSEQVALEQQVASLASVTMRLFAHLRLLWQCNASDQLARERALTIESLQQQLALQRDHNADILRRMRELQQQSQMQALQAGAPTPSLSGSPVRQPVRARSFTSH